MPSSLIVMDELNERSTSMGNSVSVPVGEGGEEGKAGMVKLSARGDDDNESIMFIVSAETDFGGLIGPLYRSAIRT